MVDGIGAGPGGGGGAEAVAAADAAEVEARGGTGGLGRGPPVGADRGGDRLLGSGGQGAEFDGAVIPKMDVAVGGGVRAVQVEKPTVVGTGDGVALGIQKDGVEPLVEIVGIEDVLPDLHFGVVEKGNRYGIKQREVIDPHAALAEFARHFAHD